MNHINYYKWHILACTILVSLISSALAQAPTFTSISFNKANLQPYEKFEVTIKLSRDVLKYYDQHNAYDSTRSFVNKYRFPHDSAEVHLLAIITSPGGRVFRVNGFYFQQFYHQNGSCGNKIGLSTIPGKWQIQGVYTPDTLKTYLDSEIMFPDYSNAHNAQDCWKLRFTPDSIVGTWSVHLIVSDKYGVSGGTRLFTTKDTSFSVAGAPANDGFLRILEGRHRYIYRERTHHMEYQVPGPTNVRSISGEYGCSFLSVIEDLKDNNINLLRVWIDGDIEWEWFTPLKLIGYDARHQAIYSRIFNQMNCSNLDTLFEVCYQNGINIQLCLFRPSLSTGDDGIGNNAYPMYHYSFAYRGSNSYNSQQYKQFNIGEMVSPLEFYRHVNKMQRNMVRYATARWGYATNLEAWEIGNELDIDHDTFFIKEVTTTKMVVILSKQYHDDTVKTWFYNIKNAIRYYDPHKHIVTSSIKYMPEKLSQYSTSKLNFQQSLPNDSFDFDIYSGGDAVIRNFLDLNLLHKYTTLCPVCPDETFIGKKPSDSTFLPEEDLLKHLVKKTLKNNDAWSKLKDIPFMVQEWGFDGFCGQNEDVAIRDSGLTLWDPYGVQHHNMHWAMLFSHSYGLPLSFNGPGYGEKLFLWQGAGNFWKTTNDIPDDAIPDFRRFGNFRQSSLFWPDMSSFCGWVQDTTFTLPRLKRNHFGYLRTFAPRFKPAVPVKHKYTHLLPISSDGVYKVEYVSTVTGLVRDTLTLLTTDSLITALGPPGFTVKKLSIPFPEWMAESPYGDFAFRAKKQCSPRNFMHVNGRTFGQGFGMEPSDTLKIIAACGGYSVKDSIIITEVDSLGNPVNFFKKTLYLPFSVTDTLHFNFSGSDLPIWCAGAQFEPGAVPKRYFKVTLYTADCGNTVHTRSLTYYIKPTILSPNLTIDASRGQVPSNRLSRRFGQDLILDNHLTTGANHCQYYLEETNSANASGSLVVNVGNNAGIGWQGMAEYLNDAVGSPPFSMYNTYLQGSSTNTRYYRVILFSGRYLACSVPNFYAPIKTDTAYISVPSCHANAYFTLDGDTGYTTSNPFDWFPEDTVEAIPAPEGATRLTWYLQRLDGVGNPVGHIENLSYGSDGAYHQLNLKSLWQSFIQAYKNNPIPDTAWFGTETRLRLQIKYSNSGQGGCDGDKYWSQVIRVNHCTTVNHFKLSYNNLIQEHDTVWIDEGDTVYVDPSFTRGINKINCILEARYGGSYSLGGEVYGIPKAGKFDVNILCQSPTYYFLCHYPYLPVMEGDSTIYRLSLTGLRNGLAGCTATVKYMYIIVKKAPSRTVTLAGETWTTGELHEFCDTSTWLPLVCTHAKGTRLVRYTLEEMEPTVVGYTWKVIRRFEPTTNTKYVYMDNYGYHDHRWSGSVLAGKQYNLEANAISRALRMYPLQKNRVWRLRGAFYFNSDSANFNFLFGFHQCTVAPPLGSNQSEPDSVIVINTDSNLICKTFPVPADQNLTIACSGNIRKILTFDIHGQPVPLSFHPVGATVWKTDCSELTPGVYLLQIVNTRNQLLHAKVIKL